ncbi:LAMI_0D10858g1_1 [Lachancea mirantina]|uniref:Large ribosomal subunit protein uL23m n=1 Tax=Lachancea mirantina TaxID=1230905 RepID=A0A1G4JF32_9SACH|nr:LAMI_0D10858g1_1 [Lachancea mirantina]
MPRLARSVPRAWTRISEGVGKLRSLATLADVSNAKANDQQQTLVRDESLTVSQKILSKSRTGISQGRPHFKVGGTELFFPKARVILLRPNAKHTPYQAKFIVPKSFNKLDLRDYLFHLYGLRAMNITTQLLHGKYTRVNPVMPRYRQPQIKKMTIDMAEPFIWPEEPEDKEAWSGSLVKELNKYREEKLRIGSDQFKPGTAFEGALGPYRPAPQPFVPRLLGRRLENNKRRSQSRVDKLSLTLKVDKYAQASE